MGLGKATSCDESHPSNLIFSSSFISFIDVSGAFSVFSIMFVQPDFIYIAAGDSENWRSQLTPLEVQFKAGYFLF